MFVDEIGQLIHVNIGVKVFFIPWNIQINYLLTKDFDFDINYDVIIMFPWFTKWVPWIYKVSLFRSDHIVK